MTIQMEYQSSPGGSYDPFDLVANKVGNMKLIKSIKHPGVLTFKIYQASYTTPLQWGWFIRMWDDAGEDPDGDPFDDTNPMFEGYIWKIDPLDETNCITYTCYDTSQYCGNTIPVMSTAWAAGTPPVDGTGAVPRLVYNCKLDNDDDYAFERAHDLTVGQMIAQILDDAILPLRYRNGAPAAASAYDSSETANFTFKPQDKIVLQDTSIREALQMMLFQMYPDWAMDFRPKDRTWHFFRKSDAPAITLTLNDFDVGNLYPVQTCQVWRSVDGKAPAVKFYGPETTSIEVFSTLDGTLTILDSVFLEGYNSPDGMADVYGATRFQIVNTAKRRGARLLPDYRFAEMGYTYNGSYTSVVTRSPFLQFTFDGGSTWQTLLGVNFDFQLGIADSGYPTFFWSDRNLVPGSTQNYFVPNGYRLVWAPYTTPLTVRFPSSGFSGTSNTVAGMNHEFKRYAEELAVGYEYGTPVTTATRLAQFTILAEEWHKQVKDIATAGFAVLFDLKYDFLWLNKRLNFAGVDANGGAITTGWEAANAVLTDVTYDFDTMLTTLSFSSDVFDYGALSIDQMKKRLKIGPVMRRVEWTQTNIMGRYKSAFTRNQSPFIDYVAGIRFQQNVGYYDKATGNLDAPLAPAGVQQQAVNFDPLSGQLGGNNPLSRA